MLLFMKLITKWGIASNLNFFPLQQYFFAQDCQERGKTTHLIIRTRRESSDFFRPADNFCVKLTGIDALRTVKNVAS